MAVRAAVTEVVISEADTAEFLSEERYGYIEHISELYGTKFEDIISAYISSYVGESWGMNGRIYKFNLTDELKAHIRKFGLEEIYVDDVGGNVRLENLTLYKGKKKLFCCLSHEVFCGYDYFYIDDSLKEEVLAAAYGVLRKDDTFKEMKKICAKLASYDRKKIKDDIFLLFNLCNYVDIERKDFFTIVPERECSYVEFCAVASNYLTSDIIAELEKSESYLGLYPFMGSYTAGMKEEEGRFRGAPLYKKVVLELRYIEIILGIERCVVNAL